MFPNPPSLGMEIIQSERGSGSRHGAWGSRAKDCDCCSRAGRPADCALPLRAARPVATGPCACSGPSVSQNPRPFNVLEIRSAGARAALGWEPSLVLSVRLALARSILRESCVFAQIHAPLLAAWFRCAAPSLRLCPKQTCPSESLAQDTPSPVLSCSPERDRDPPAGTHDPECPIRNASPA